MVDNAAAEKAKPSLIPIGVTSVATGLGGFAFGIFAQLGLAGLLAQQSRFALTIFCAAAALILATGRATLPIEGAKHWAIDGLIGMFGIAALVGMVLVFTAPAEVNTFARFDSSLAFNTDDPKLVPKVELGSGLFAPLGSDDVPIKVTSIGGVTVRIENLESLLTQYAADETSRRNALARNEILQNLPAAAK